MTGLYQICIDYFTDKQALQDKYANDFTVAAYDVYRSELRALALSYIKAYPDLTDFKGYLVDDAGPEGVRDFLNRYARDKVSLHNQFIVDPGSYRRYETAIRDLARSYIDKYPELSNVCVFDSPAHDIQSWAV